MAVLPLTENSRLSAQMRMAKQVDRVLREQVRRKQVVNAILLAIAFLQVLQLPGAILMKSSVAIGTVMLGLVLCAVAMIFNYLGRVTIVSLLLILVVDLGCGLMLLTTPMGLDVSDLPVFDVLIVSELIAVSLLPAKSVFPVALSNIAFIIVDLMLQPRTMDLNMVLSSSMGYNAVVQPISLQIVVAVVAYIWVSNALRALARADRAEEVAELQRREVEMQRREAERSRQLDEGVTQLSQVLVQVANGDRMVRVNLRQDDLLWRVGNSVNLLLTRLGKTGQAELENRRLQDDVTRLAEAGQESKHLRDEVLRLTEIKQREEQENKRLRGEVARLSEARDVVRVLERHKE